ncbi:divisome protein SepX/GlpR, partial [Prauserella alba]
MPSSLIIIGLAAAWLVVLVPMVARKRQEVTQTSDAALAGRIVRSGTRNNGRREFAMTRNAGTRGGRGDDEFDDSVDYAHSDTDGDTEDDAVAGIDDYDYDYDEPGEADEPPDSRERRYARRADAGESDLDEPGAGGRGESAPRPYRPGRGGFDPEAAEMNARAKYAYRQRVVLLLLVAAVVSAIVAAAVLPMLWWLHGAVDVALVGYLAYLRRQVRIEEEIRERRMARYSGSPRKRAAEPEWDDEDAAHRDVRSLRDARDSAELRHDRDADRSEPPRRDRHGPELVNVERRRAPRPPRNAVVVDIDDE